MMFNKYVIQAVHLFCNCILHYPRNVLVDPGVDSWLSFFPAPDPPWHYAYGDPTAVFQLEQQGSTGISLQHSDFNLIRQETRPRAGQNKKSIF